MTSLELLAPARNAEIGIAAIDCGADAVYIAGPGFGAREAAGNSIGDIRVLCAYAHRFGVRIFVTVNTILFDEELDEAGRMMADLQDAGADGFIVQDPAVIALARKNGITVPLHASTQCAIRTPETAEFYESLGFSRLVLEREMSLDGIRAVRKAVEGELEFFIHGALCVCYSGQCYLSEYLSGRSANRGACVQACRSRYDLIDSEGKVLVRDKALLSLKDYNLLSHLGELADAGICSFKIEGRLKNISYVRNVVRQYSMAMDDLVAMNPEKYVRSSFGRVVKGFFPDPSKTFNRGYTDLYINGKRGKWSSMDAPKSMGEGIGTVRSVRPAGKDRMEVVVDTGARLSNGDGFAFATRDDVIGFRGDVCSGNKITAKPVGGLKPGMKLFRNISAEFEKELSRNACERLIGVKAALEFTGDAAGGYKLTANAVSEDGRTASLSIDCGDRKADNGERIKALAENQMGKKSGIYSFSLSSLGTGTADGSLPLVSASAINSLRRSLAEALDSQPFRARPLRNTALAEDISVRVPEVLTYKANVANSLTKEIFRSRRAVSVDDAYETGHQKDAELMRTKYCIRHELGMCPRWQGAKESGPLFLRNNGRTLALGFDCKKCEMTVKA